MMLKSSVDTRCYQTAMDSVSALSSKDTMIGIEEDSISPSSGSVERIINQLVETIHELQDSLSEVRIGSKNLLKSNLCVLNRVWRLI